MALADWRSSPPVQRVSLIWDRSYRHCANPTSPQEAQERQGKKPHLKNPAETLEEEVQLQGKANFQSD
eukprot:1519601-Rhodomonas_salina.1